MSEELISINRRAISLAQQLSNSCIRLSKENSEIIGIAFRALGLGLKGEPTPEERKKLKKQLIEVMKRIPEPYVK